MFLACLAAPALAEPVTVPSGQPVEFVDLVKEANGTPDSIFRYRFVAPQIARDGGTIGIDAALEDIDALCKSFVLPQLEADAEMPERVVISLSDRPVEFGVPTPAATQFFEAFRIENGACVWEGF